MLVDLSLPEGLTFFCGSTDFGVQESTGTSHASRRGETMDLRKSQQKSSSKRGTHDGMNLVNSTILFCGNAGCCRRTAGWVVSKLKAASGWWKALGSALCVTFEWVPVSRNSSVPATPTHVTFLINTIYLKDFPLRQTFLFVQSSTVSVDQMFQSNVRFFQDLNRLVKKKCYIFRIRVARDLVFL